MHFGLGAFFFWSVQKAVFYYLLQVRIKGRYIIFTGDDAIKVPLNQAKRFSFTPEDFMITLQNLHAYVIKITNIHFT